MIKQFTDEQLERKVASLNRRQIRNQRCRQYFEILSQRSVLRFVCTVSQMKAAAKSIAMKHSQIERRAA